MKRWVRIVLIVVLAAGLVVGLFGMLRRQTEDRKGAESYAEAAAIAGAELPAAESAAQTPAEEQETQDPYLQMFARMDVEALRQVNPEVLGWLWLPNTQISYPLMQGTEFFGFQHADLRPPDAERRHVRHAPLLRRAGALGVRAAGLRARGRYGLHLHDLRRL